MINILKKYLNTLLLSLLKVFFKKKVVSQIVLVIAFVLLNIDFAYAADSGSSGALFSELIKKGGEIFTGMRDVIYIVSGLGIIAVAIGGFFGNLNWKWLSAIIIGLMVIGMTGGIIEYLTGEAPQEISDTLK